MDALYIILLALGAQAAALAAVLTVWLVRLGATASPQPPGLALSAAGPAPSQPKPVAPQGTVVELPGLAGLAMVAEQRPPHAA